MEKIDTDYKPTRIERYGPVRAQAKALRCVLGQDTLLSQSPQGAHTSSVSQFVYVRNIKKCMGEY